MEITKPPQKGGFVVSPYVIPNGSEESDGGRFVLLLLTWLLIGFAWPSEK